MITLHRFNFLIITSSVLALWGSVTHAGVFLNRLDFHAAATDAGLTLGAEDYSNISSIGAPLHNAFGNYSLASEGLTYNGIQYVGHIDNDFHTNFNSRFPSLWETYNYDNFSLSPYSLNGGQNIFAGRSSADVSFLDGPKSAFGIEIGFDRNQPSAYAGIATSVPTMSVIYYLANGGTLQQSLHIDGSSQFIGYVGPDIAGIQFKSLLRDLNPTFTSGGFPGYYSYILFDGIEFEVPRLASVPEPISFTAWGVLLCIGGVACHIRKRRND